MFANANSMNVCDGLYLIDPHAALLLLVAVADSRALQLPQLYVSCCLELCPIGQQLM